MARSVLLGTALVSGGLRLGAAADLFEPVVQPAGQRRLQMKGNVTYCEDEDPFSCTLGRACQTSCIPLERGVCIWVASNARSACWDVCNPNHESIQFTTKTSDDDMVTMTYKGMVDTVRAGENPNVQCPGLEVKDPCPPGKKCPASKLKYQTFGEDRGLCVVDPNSHDSRSCWDMCDTRHSLASFAIGTEAGTEDYIMSVRASSACPRMTWWMVILTLLGVVGLVLLCLGLGIMFRTRMSRRSRETADLKESFQDHDQFHEEDEEGNGLGMPPEPSYYQQEPIGQDMMPPEPPRADSGSMRPPVHDMPSSPYGASARSGGYGVPPPPTPPLQTFPQSSSPYSPGGRPIPGLQEPENLLNLTQQQLHSQAQYGALTTAISAPPVGTYPGAYQGAPGSFSAPLYGGMPGHGQVGVPSFHTVPPQSLQVAPGGGSPAFYSGRMQ